MEDTIICSKADIYKFFSNRDILKWPKSINTITSDLQEELSINYKSAIASYIAMCKQKAINKIILESSKSNAKDFIMHMKTTLANLDPEYGNYSETKYLISSNIYRIAAPNYIYTFINQHKTLLPKCITSTITPLVYNTIYNKQNQKLNNNIRKAILVDYFTKLDNSFKDYYNYCRFKYLYDKINEYKLTPFLYNKYTGALYFSFSYSLSAQKEQIFEGLSTSNNNIENIDLDYIKIYINSSIGEITKYFRLSDKRYKHYQISDDLSYTIPNIVRELIINLLQKLSNKNSKFTYNEVLSYTIKKNIIVENYCEKIDSGTYFKVPINNEWIIKSANDLKLLSINDIDIPFLLEEYQEDISSILQAITSLKI